jgi:hypothetical protein
MDLRKGIGTCRQGIGGLMPEVVLKARTPAIAELVEQCARGQLPFDGPDSLYSKVHAMGYKCTSLYEMVRAAEVMLAMKGTDDEPVPDRTTLDTGEAGNVGQGTGDRSSV